LSGKCEICGTAALSLPQSYPRIDPLRRQKVDKDELLTCSVCRKPGCENCLVIVEEQIEDFFMDLAYCQACLAAKQAAGVGTST